MAIQQVGNLRYDFVHGPADRPDKPGAKVMATICRLEIGDTAGWKPVENLRYDKLVRLCQSPGWDCWIGRVLFEKGFQTIREM